MSAFSYTAPFISEEDEKAERLSLSKDEKEEIHLDLYGTSNTNNNDTCRYGNVVNNNNNSLSQSIPDDIPELLQKLNEAVIDIPSKDKQDYIIACEKIPNIVHVEANPLIFLEYENYNPISAAKRMTVYWKVRKQLFGNDRAFLPMTLNGAMAQDIDVIHKGFIQILPNDINGRSVLFCDHVRLVKPVVTRDEVARVLFYNFHVISNKKTKRERCIVSLTCMKGYDLYLHFDRILSKKILLMSSGFPVHSVGIHFYTGSGKSVLNLVMPVLKQIFGKEFRLRLVMHAGSDTEILVRLMMYGITGDHAGLIVNGLHKRCNYFENWLIEQTMIEESKLVTNLV